MTSHVIDPGPAGPARYGRSRARGGVAMSVTTLPATFGPAAARRWWALGVVVAAQFMFVVDAFVVNVAIPTIRHDLGASAGEMEAVLALYQIAYAASVITGSRLGDIYGRRRVFLAGILAFTVTSVWCG